MGVKRQPRMDYGTRGLQNIDKTKAETILNCYIMGNIVETLVQLKAEGKNSSEMVDYYRPVVEEKGLRFVEALIPIVESENPESSDRLDYSRGVVKRCLGSEFSSKESMITIYCYRQSQFINLAFAFRREGEPMSGAFTKMPAGNSQVKQIMDTWLENAKLVDRSHEGVFRAETFSTCLNLPPLVP